MVQSIVEQIILKLSYQQTEGPKNIFFTIFTDHWYVINEQSRNQKYH